MFSFLCFVDFKPHFCNDNSLKLYIMQAIMGSYLFKMFTIKRFYIKCN
jgi:hypothetical protein